MFPLDQLAYERMLNTAAASSRYPDTLASG